MMARVLGLSLLLVTAIPVLAMAQSASPGVIDELGQPAKPQVSDEIARFCSNISDAARERRHALQTAELKKLQGELDDRIALLEKKRGEYEVWLKRRDEFTALAEKAVVDIYAKMRPDAAAERMAELSPELAASILLRLDARISSVILNEMELKAAAMLTGIMASAARKDNPS